MKRNNKKKGGIKSQMNQDIPELSEAETRQHIEKLLWSNGLSVCRHCGSGNAYRMQGEACRPGLCRDCKKQFTVTVGTIFEDSHISLSKWVRANHLMATSKKGISALQLMRNLGLGSYQSAWFMSHRIRLAMKKGPVAGMLKDDVQIDETYIGGKPRPQSGEVRKRGRGTKKTPVLALVETNGNVHSAPIERVTAQNLRAAMLECVDPSARILTDEFEAYVKPATNFSGGHSTVNHSSGHYVNDDGFHTNTVESYVALLKRGIHGAFHHVSKQHLHRY